MSLKSEIGDMAGSEPSKDRQAWAEVTPDGGELSTGTLNAPLALETDWSSVLIGFGLDPNVFQIVDDTVRMSKWQSSKRLENGDRDLIWLYSYKARFKRKTASITDLDIETLRNRIAKWKPAATTTKQNSGIPCTFVFNWADLQLGKSAGGGVEGAAVSAADGAA